MQKKNERQILVDFRKLFLVTNNCCETWIDRNDKNDSLSSDEPLCLSTTPGQMCLLPSRFHKYHFRLQMGNQYFSQ